MRASAAAECKRRGAHHLALVPLGSFWKHSATAGYLLNRLLVMGQGAVAVVVDGSPAPQPRGKL